MFNISSSVRKLIKSQPYISFVLKLDYIQCEYTYIIPILPLSGSAPARRSKKPNVQVINIYSVEFKLYRSLTVQATFIHSRKAAMCSL